MLKIVKVPVLTGFAVVFILTTEFNGIIVITG